MSLTFGSLFAGIGGIDLGFERAGMVCKWQVEIDEYARRVLAKHWPGVHRHDDIRTWPSQVKQASYSWRGCPVGPFAPDVIEDIASEYWHVDVIAGGFPCQDISYAGKGAGLDGERSGLFYEAMRVVRELEPKYVVLENVAALLTRGMGDVLGTLASIGFDAEWHCVPAAAVGAPHIRDRVFIVGSRTDANANSDAQRLCRKIPDTQGKRFRAGRQGRAIGSGAGQENTAEVANPNSSGMEERQRKHASRPRSVNRAQPNRSEWWATEPDVGRVANGVPRRVDRLRGLGNAVVPQVAEFIGRMIVEHHKAMDECEGDGHFECTRCGK